MKSKPPFFSANRRLYNKLMPSDISDPAECLENFSRKCKGRIFAKQGSAEAGHPLTEGTQGGGTPGVGKENVAELLSAGMEPEGCFGPRV